MKRMVNFLAKSPTLANLTFSIVLFAIQIKFSLTATRYPSFANRLKEKNLVVQIKLKDNSRGRYFILMDWRHICRKKAPALAFFIRTSTGTIAALSAAA